MKSRMNISAAIWPKLSVAKATRHSWLNQARVSGLKLSGSYRGHENPEINPDSLEASR